MANIVNIAPLMKLQFNQNGVPLAGGLLFTYAAGTATKLATYVDPAGNTPNTNPIVLDANGQCSCFMLQGDTYKFVLSPANDTDPPTNPFWTQDQINGTPNIVVPVSVANGGTGAATAPAALGNLGAATCVATIAALRAQPKTGTGYVLVAGYTAQRDGQGYGLLYAYDPTDTTSADNGINIIVATDGGRWKLVFAPSRAVRVAVTTAGTLDLTGLAGTSDDVQLNGNAAITAVNLAAGRVVRCIANGPFILTNNANIVTNTTANIAAAVGDFFLLRATATNVVEVLGYIPYASTGQYGRVILGAASNVTNGSSGLIPDCAAVNAASGGYGTWRNQTGGRALGTNYTNTSGRPLFYLVITSGSTNPDFVNMIVGGVTMPGPTGPSSQTYAAYAVVPPGAVYSATAGGTSTLNKWFELF